MNYTLRTFGPQRDYYNFNCAKTTLLLMKTIGITFLNCVKNTMKLNATSLLIVRRPDLLLSVQNLLPINRFRLKLQLEHIFILLRPKMAIVKCQKIPL